MMKWWKSLFRNHKGFTIVELICSIAILSIIMTGVGSALVIGARSYRNGNVELGLQQQAQIASNLLTNLIIDSDEVVQASDGMLIVKKVESDVTVTYTVFLSDGELKYYTSVDSTERTLAENITGFVVNQAEGENVDFSLKVETGGRSYESDYHVTPRNGISSEGEALSGSISLFVENKLILEPGQTYDLNVRISGTTNTNFTVDSTDGGINSSETQINKVDSSIQIKVGNTEMDSFHFRVISDADSTVFQNVDVLIRRVNAINVNGYRTAGTVNKAGTEYKVSAVLAGTNLEKEPGAWYDVDYVDPYTAYWTYEFTKGGITYPASDYIEITGEGIEGNIPYITFKLKQNMTEGCKLRVTSTALHPEGIDLKDLVTKRNKDGVKYDTVNGYWELEYQAWKRNGKLDIGLGLDDTYFWAATAWNPNRSFIGNAQVDVDGYTAAQALGYATSSWDADKHFNYYNTGAVDSAVTAEFGSGDANLWKLVLNSETSADHVIIAYSSPYFTLNGDGLSGGWSDIAYYHVRVWYEGCAEPHAGESGEVINEDFPVEDVRIKFKNAMDAGWSSSNKVYVTTSDTIEKYKVYYMFDKGWEEGTSYYFADVNRFVGVIHDDGITSNDLRYDIAVEQYNDIEPINYLTFSLPSDKKQECMDKTAGDGGILREIYEYNPFLGISSELIPKEAQDLIDGCEGEVEFHFVEPNITGNTTQLKVFYCPTPDEFAALGNVYYVSGTDAGGVETQITIVSGGNSATYKEVSGGTTKTVSLTWNGTDGTNGSWVAN